jgi:hypothetical protein
MLSYTTEGISIIPKDQPRRVAYVEPKPEVFRQLVHLSVELQNRLKALGRLNEEVDGKLARYADMATHLARIADDELAGKQMPESDVEFCRSGGGLLQSLTAFSQEFGEKYTSEPSQRGRGSRWPTTNEDRHMALVADVHNAGDLALEEGVGNPLRMYAAVPCWGAQYLAVGACFSYYEFTKPATERMTDAEWQALSPKPPMPEWTKSFVVTP